MLEVFDPVLFYLRMLELAEGDLQNTVVFVQVTHFELLGLQVVVPRDLVDYVLGSSQLLLLLDDWLLALSLGYFRLGSRGHQNDVFAD